MADPYTESLCAGMLEGARAVAKYMREKARPRLDSILHPSPREILVSGIFLRSLCWMETLARLDRVQDFQAVSAGTRGLLEACVDAVLIDHDDTGQLTTKMADWATSAKFLMSQEMVNFYAGRNQSVPEQQEPLKLFYDANKSFVSTLRAKHWGGKHPQRWTNSALLSDCIAADKFEPILIPAELGMPLAEFHETEIRRLHWYVHASGTAFLENAPATMFFLMCALGFNWSSDLAVLISALTMKALKLDQAIEYMDSEKRDAKNDQLTAIFQQLKNETP
jgi:hypothetical protein